ncbi:MAG: site-specific integrase, partial [Acidobacteriota bacterium]
MAPPSPWRRLVDAYLDSLATERGLSRHTVAAYGRDLARLGADLEGRGIDPLVADAPVLQGHLRRLRGGGLASRSVARGLAAVRGFYGFLVAEGERKDNPAVHLASPKTWRQLPKVLSEEQVDALLAAPDLEEDKGIRDKAMIELLYATG